VQLDSHQQLVISRLGYSQVPILAGVYTHLRWRLDLHQQWPKPAGLQPAALSKQADTIKNLLYSIITEQETRQHIVMFRVVLLSTIFSQLF
jgi:hypothetical protein